MIKINSFVYVYGKKTLIGKVLSIRKQKYLDIDEYFDIYKIELCNRTNDVYYFLKDDLRETSIKEMVIDAL